jgi:hypothetical protein
LLRNRTSATGLESAERAPTVRAVGAMLYRPRDFAAKNAKSAKKSRTRAEIVSTNTLRET